MKKFTIVLSIFVIIFCVFMLVFNNKKEDKIPQQYIEYVRQFNEEWSYHPESLKIYSDLYVVRGHDNDKEKDFYCLWFEVSGKNPLGEEVDPYGNMILCYVNEDVSYVSDEGSLGYKNLEELYNTTGKITWFDGSKSNIMCYDGQQLAEQIGCDFVIRN